MKRHFCLSFSLTSVYFQLQFFDNRNTGLRYSTIFLLNSTELSKHFLENEKKEHGELNYEQVEKKKKGKTKESKTCNLIEKYRILESPVKLTEKMFWPVSKYHHKKSFTLFVLE